MDNEQQQAENTESQNVDKGKLTIFYELPKFQNEVTEYQSLSMSVDVSLSFKFQPILG